MRAGELQLDLSKAFDDSFAFLRKSGFLVRLSSLCDFFYSLLSQVPLVDLCGVGHSTIARAHLFVLAVVDVVVANNMLVRRLSWCSPNWSLRRFVLFLFRRILSKRNC